MSETALLCAVRDHLRTQLDYRESECDIEFDEFPPTAVSRIFVVVMSGGWTPGPANNTSGGVLDEVYGVDVSVVLRSASMPRDRQHKFYLDNVDGINSRVRGVIAKIHFNYELMQAANALIDNDVSTEKFIHPLMFAGVDPRPRQAGAEIFASTGGPSAGLIRTARFRGARRIQYQSSQV